MKVIKVCKLLDWKQRKKIMKAGFGSFLDIKCSKLFLELCKYLMDHFNPDTSALEFPEDERGILPITVDTVFEVLGIPKGALPVIYQYDSVSVKYVLDLLEVEDGRQPKISDIETRLTKMVCFLAPTTGVRVSPKCYPSLVNVSQINKLDWCRFTINILIQTAKAKNKNCFKACMPLLMVIAREASRARRTRGNKKGAALKGKYIASPEDSDSAEDASDEDYAAEAVDSDLSGSDRGNDLVGENDWTDVDDEDDFMDRAPEANKRRNSKEINKKTSSGKEFQNG
ncbi:hypothetical protein BRADI_4g17111v3 [Brachypodium distachyon]|uniref:Aminotransferase-like plant mobile domain-containing protein n=1 Tax=Brachypodium distachyon TaxID=15368 RepID=A0A0Q3HJ16_BRADI|nr:hypothetical protein BRADI_4g17111v3 [Brachypodium distachyon]